MTPRRASYTMRPRPVATVDTIAGTTPSSPPCPEYRVHCSFSALDAYFGLAGTSPVFEYFDGDLVALAGSVSGLSFPGLPYADAEVAGADGSRTLYRCDDAESRTAFIQTELRTLPGKRHFEARGGVYESLAEPAPVPRPGAPPELVLFEAAILASRYDYHPVIRPDLPLPYDVSTAMQRDMLDQIGRGSCRERVLVSVVGG